ncbi:MAG TPA: EamA family transporter, partial [Actinomycetota bacterium]|nr:EamA family transporter [Actinomycetota bacterium]
MALLLGALAGVSYGVADFLGGLASSAWRPERVVAAVQGVGIVVALAVLPFVGSVLAPADVAWGAAAGVAGGLGIVALYRALALGPMNVAAPVAAVVGSVVPVAMGLASGERPGPIAAAGVAFGIVAVSLVGSSPHAEAGGGPRRRVALVAALAGLGLGAATVAFGQTS